MDTSSRVPQTRLIDYVLVVGVRKPTLDSTETPELLRRFPQKDHKDFTLPGDVVFFCQPEGCSTVSKKFSLREANSFVFTLTEKDSGKVRYGVCVNVFRPCSNFACKDRNDCKETTLSVPKRSRSIRNKRDICMSLTSLCLISHHPFFPTFRECLFFLRKMIDSRTGINKCDKNDNVVQGLNSWSVFTCTEDQKTSSLAGDMEEVETWIQRLLLAQAPVPGRSRVELQLHSPDSYPPLTFAIPESNRFPLMDFPIHIPLELLGVETCLKVLTCILLEHKVSENFCMMDKHRIRTYVEPVNRWIFFSLGKRLSQTSILISPYVVKKCNRNLNKFEYEEIIPVSYKITRKDVLFSLAFSSVLTL